MSAAVAPAASGSPRARIAWLDQLRGWGMLLVMLGHAPFAQFPHKLIYSFHIPLFFALSGWLHDPARHSRLRELARSRWKTLILPYFAYSAIGYAGLAAMWATGAHPWNLDAWTPVRGAIMGWRNSSPFNGTLWFVSCLVMTEFAFHLVHRLAGRRILYTLPVTLAILFGFLYSPLATVHWHAPWSCDLAMVAIFFFALGRFIRESDGRAWFRWLAAKAWWIVPIAWFAAVLPAGELDMYSLCFQTPVLMVVGATLGVLGCFLLAPRLPEWGWLSYIGRHSLVILALHEWFAYGIVRMVLHKLAPGFAASTGGWAAAGLGAVFLLAGLAIVIPLCKVMDRWFPALVGGGRK